MESHKTEVLPQPLFPWSELNRISFSTSLIPKRRPWPLTFGFLADDQEEAWEEAAEAWEEEEDAWEEAAEGAGGAARSQEGGVCQTGQTASSLSVS